MKFFTRAFYSLLPLTVATSCSVGPKYHAPKTDVAGHFSKGKQEGVSSDITIAKWWRRFDDTMLNRLIDKALENNRDLMVAAARVDQAHAIFRATRFNLFPIVTSNGSWTRTHSSGVNSSPGLNQYVESGGKRLPVVPAIPPTDPNLQVLDMGLAESWEVDLWGHVRNAVKAAKADWANADELRNDTMVSLISALASAYMELRGLQLQLQVAEKNAANQKETLDLTEKLLQGGRGTELDTSRALAQLKQTESDIPPLRTAIVRDIHAISVLIGGQPQVLEDSLQESRPIPQMPERIRVGTPADLLRRRPDIRAAERALEATSLRLNVQTAELFPRVAFNSTLDVQAKNFGKLGGPGILATSFGPEVSWPALNIWQVKAQVDAASAQVRGQLATYQKTVLTALQESEDALTDYGQQMARTALLQEASAASEKAAKLANDRFQQGAADFLTVLQAELTMLQAQSTLAQSQTTEAISIVTIYRALGGGWEGIGVDTKPVVQ